MKKLYLLTFLILSFHLSFSQQLNTTVIENKYIDYFLLDYETFYTQTNKKVFFVNEELWFKTYIYNIKTQKPYISTTNVYVSIFDENGTLIKKKVFHAKGGMTHGDFLIDDSYPSGNYTLKTTSNWSRNFNEDNNHYQQFKVIGKVAEGKTSKVKVEYDFQLLPEQGYFLNDAQNTIGFKLINNLGKSVRIKKGEVIDELNNILTTFKGNLFGLGKFKLNIELHKKYSVRIELDNGETITKNIENIKQEGVALSVDNSHNDFVKIKLTTNQATLNKINDLTYYLSIHRDGNIGTMDIQFKKEQLEYEISIPKKLLLPAINIITLFTNENKPIAERIIFNNANTPIKELEVKQINYKQDSSLVRITTNNIKSNLSVSVLPAENFSNEIKTNLFSTFLLSPYVNGNIENPSYYFKNINPKKLYNLDLLLLTQGWSKFSWSNIFNKTPKVTYAFETGFQIKGKLNNYTFKKGDEIILLSKDNLIQLNQKLDTTEYFSFDNLYLGDSTQINFSIKDRKGKFSKPIAYYNIYPTFSNEFSNPIPKKLFDIKSSLNNKFHHDFIIDTENLLDTVVLKTITKTPSKKMKNFVTGAALGKRISFEDIPIKRTPITDYIRKNGFEVINTGHSVRIISKHGGTNWTSSFSPKLFIDNVEYNVSQQINRGIPSSGPSISGSNDSKPLASLTLDDVEEMFISHHGNLVASPGGVIYIFTKQKINHKRTNSFDKSIIKFGYSQQKEYYSPLYGSKQNETFTKYGVIDWIPNIKSNNNGEFSFKLPNSYKNVKFYIEGMGEDGSLFSTIKTIDLE